MAIYVQLVDENAGSQRLSQDSRFGHDRGFEIMSVQVWIATLGERAINAYIYDF